MNFVLLVASFAKYEKGGKMLVLGDLIRARASDSGDKVIFICKDQEMTYRQLYERSTRLANALAQLGLKKGDHVAVLMQNSFEIVECYFANGLLGLATIPLNTMYTGREIEYIVNNSESKALITKEKFYSNVAGVRENLEELENLIVQSDNPIPDTYSYDHLLNEAPKTPVDVEVDPEDVAIILYTSGTTGTPKGVMLTHRGIMLNAGLVKDAIGWVEQDRFVGVLPMFHSFSFSFDILQMMMVKASTAIFERFDTKEVVEGIEKYQCTALAGVPTMFTYIYNYPDLEKNDLSCLRIGDCGGGPVPVELVEEFQKGFGMTLLESYGLTECSPVTCVERPNMERRPGSCGHVFPGMTAKIVDIHGKEVPDGEVGELIIDGPTHMKGYFKMPVETKEAIKDGWLYTGDLFKKDKDGYLYFVDRLKYMIVTAGYNIYPKEVENVLYNHPAILEAAVIGIPDKMKGDIPKAYIVLQGDQKPTKKEIIDYCRQTLAAYKVPRIVEFVDALPQTASGKIKKYVLKEKK